MVTFLILLTVSLVLAAAVSLIVLVGGTGLAIVFGDLVVFGLIIYGLLRFIRRRKSVP